MTADTVKNIIMIILLVIGLGCLMKAKITFQRRQQTTPDNVWSEDEKKLRKIGYVLMVVAVIIEGFVRV